MIFSGPKFHHISFCFDAKKHAWEKYYNQRKFLSCPKRQRPQSLPDRRRRDHRRLLVKIHACTIAFWSSLVSQYGGNIYYMTNKSPAKPVTSQSATKNITTPQSRQDRLRTKGQTSGYIRQVMSAKYERTTSLSTSQHLRCGERQLRLANANINNLKRYPSACGLKHVQEQWQAALRPGAS